MMWVRFEAALWRTFWCAWIPTCADYRELLRAVAPAAKVFGLMDHAGTGLHETGGEVMRRLGEHLFDADEVRAWPGSLMYGDGPRDRYLFRLDDVSLEVLTSSADNLFDWIWPRLPEDLHFLRADGSTVLGDGCAGGRRLA